MMMTNLRSRLQALGPIIPALVILSVVVGCDDADAPYHKLINQRRGDGLSEPAHSYTVQVVGNESFISVRIDSELVYAGRPDTSYHGIIVDIHDDSAITVDYGDGSVEIPVKKTFRPNGHAMEFSCSGKRYLIHTDRFYPVLTILNRPGEPAALYSASPLGWL